MKNLNKEIVFLIINFLKTSEGFFEPLFWTSICIYRLYFLFFLFIYVLFIYSSLYRAYCRWSQLSQFFVLFRPVLCRDHSKSTSLAKWNFWPPFLHVTLYYFSPIFLPHLCHSQKSDKLWHEAEEDFLYVWLLKYMILYQRKYEMTGIIVLTYVHTNLYTRDTFVNKSSWK